MKNKGKKNEMIHMSSTTVKERSLKQLGKKIWKFKGIYIIMLPALIWYVLFSYVPMAGLSLAFKTYKANLGIWKSPFVGWANFERVFKDPKFFDAITTTLKLNIGRLLISFPFAILLALLLNEIRLKRSKRFLQSVFTFPHFLSWVVVASIVNNVLSYDGLVNSIIKLFGGDYFNFIGNSKFFPLLIFITQIWKASGWESIIYLAAIAGIDVEQYEAASIDGASRLKQIRYITLPSIMPTVMIMFILATGNLMTKGFHQVFNLSNAAVQDVSTTLDMYIYRTTFQSVPNFGYSTALSLIVSVINLVLLMSANKLSKKMGGSGLMG
jgi:putative aldouronate transport system permease protein